MIDVKFDYGLIPLIGSGVEAEKIQTKERIPFKIGAWNAGTLYKDEKMHNFIVEMERLNIEVMGISEMRWA